MKCFTLTFHRIDIIYSVGVQHISLYLYSASGMAKCCIEMKGFIFCVCVCVGTGVAEVKIWNGKPHSVEHEFIIIETHVRISMSRRRRRKKNRRENFLCIKHKKQQINCKLRCFLLNRRRYFTSSISHLLTPDLICSFAFSTSNHII